MPSLEERDRNIKEVLKKLMRNPGGHGEKSFAVLSGWAKRKIKTEKLRAREQGQSERKCYRALCSNHSQKGRWGGLGYCLRAGRASKSWSD